MRNFANNARAIFSGLSTSQIASSPSSAQMSASGNVTADQTRPTKNAGSYYSNVSGDGRHHKLNQQQTQMQVAYGRDDVSRLGSFEQASGGVRNFSLR